MLLVKTAVKPSDIAGQGLFAEEFIAKGTPVWKFTPGFDLRFTREQILQFPENVQRYFCVYAWKSKKSGQYCFSSDDGKYFNHSSTPNTLSAYHDDEEEVITTAVRDILPGEEITDDYNSFEEESDEDNILDELQKKYGIQTDF